MSYAKLFSHIVRSTIWMETPTTRCLWLTMLAIADRRGNVMGSIPGLAREANISLDECLEGLNRLKSPDPWSSTKDADGVRIADIDGGWLILNYEKHRNARDIEDENAKARERMRKMREKRAPRKSVTRRNKANSDASLRSDTPGSTTSTSTNASTTEQAAASSTSVVDPTLAAAPPDDEDSSWSRDACDLWIQRFGGTVAGGKLGKQLKPVVVKYGWKAIRAGWVQYLSTTDALHASGQRFAETVVDWMREAGAQPSSEAPAQPHAPGNGSPPPEIGPGTEEAVQIWDVIAGKLKLVMGAHNHGTWIRPVRGLRVEEGEEGKKILVIVVPQKEWVAHLRSAGYVERMRIAAEDSGHRGLLFKVVVDRRVEAPHNGSL